ncbi:MULTISPECIES: YqgQ family protein [unclassified Gemella]|uniref:YqgQ family protein n=1 Tax=unclassified Gemella TaxID=2624949 RepID=UPI001C04DE54|nr:MULTISPECIES: YqgQ family protein [unclassified Gemella]MBU0278277.1 YqgQ family protein [Gemella sp. zg-1178]QWQ38216.1 YqgQ family protein [Gemella sp. zg-570]
MKDFFDIQQLLKSFDIIIYMKNRLHLLQLTKFEIMELYRLGLITQDTYLRAVTIIKKEQRLLQ